MKYIIGIKQQYFHHHAYEIIHTYTDLKVQIEKTLTRKVELESLERKRKKVKYDGITADSLNNEIRNLLRGTVIQENKIMYEVNEENGVFYFSEGKSSIGGFDFAIINHEQNLISLRNLCFGTLSYADGNQRWKRFLSKNKELQQIASKLNIGAEPIGKDLSPISKSTKYTPLILGEIQFGNWALAYRDFFKVLKADVQNSIDCLIYIVPTGNLESMLSDGIVTFHKTVEIIKDYAKVISVPIWVIGLDVNIK